MTEYVSLDSVSLLHMRQHMTELPSNKRLFTSFRGALEFLLVIKRR